MTTDTLFDRQAGANNLLNKKDGGFDNLEVYRYPSDVGGNEYPHYMMFYVFTRKSELGNQITTKKGNPQTLSTGFSPDTTDLSGVIRAGATLGSFEVGKKFGKSIAGMLLSATGAETAIRSAGVAEAFTVDINSDDALEAVRALGGTIGGIGFATGANASLSDASPPDRTMFNKAIALYMPSAPSVSYQAGWNQGDIGSLGKVGGAIENLIGAVTSEGKTSTTVGAETPGGMVSKFREFGSLIDKGKNILEGFRGAFQAVGQASLRAGLREADNTFLGQLGSVENAFSATSRQAINPYRVQLFNSMGFRNFSFTYKFLPKNKSEYEQVKNIIQTFKEYMHPANLSSSLFVGYPAEFVISYYYKDKENTELFRTSRCALTNLRASYGDQDFITFKELPGGASEFNLTLTFTELELLDRERIRQGY